MGGAAPDKRSTAAHRRGAAHPRGRVLQAHDEAGKRFLRPDCLALQVVQRAREAALDLVVQNARVPRAALPARAAPGARPRRARSTVSAAASSSTETWLTSSSALGPR